MTQHTNLLRAFAEWVRAGYPNGVPQKDYVPILAVLRRQLTEHEADEVAAMLIDGAEEADAEKVDPIELRSRIAGIIDGLPLESDIKRVEEKLSDVGWRVERIR